MRKLTLLVAIAVVGGHAVTVPWTASAQACRGVTDRGEVVEVPCQGETETTTAPGRSTKTYDPDDLVTAISQVDGQTCTILATITSPQGREAVTFDRLLTQIPTFGKPLHDIWQWVIDGLPGCPSLSQQPSASLLAWSFVRQATPPPSQPHIEPGYAITGRRAFLETRGSTTDTQVFDTPLGPLTIVFEARRYTVDWGDGSELDTGPFPVPGAPFPDGKATHTFTHAERYDIVVRTEWTAHWTVAGESGDLEGLTRTERLEQFEARQLQAVRDR